MKVNLLKLALLFFSLGIYSQTNTFPSSGNVGIGTVNADAKLRIQGTFSMARFITEEDGKFEIYATRIGSSTVSNLVLGAQKNIILDPNKYGTPGNVGIGTTSPDTKLTVKGKIHAEEVKVDLSVPGPDYVFKEGYDLKSLKELQSYIKENGHLPNIPSAKQMEQNGVELGTMNMKLLERIEELTLYIIQLSKQLEKQSENISGLINQNLEQEKRIKELKNTFNGNKN